MRRSTMLPVAGFALLASACHTDDARPAPADGPCKAERVQKLVGAVLTDATAERAMRRAGARTRRVLPPGAIMTMDFRSDRLNIHVDADHRVTKVNCG